MRQGPEDLADIATLTELIEPEARALGFALVRVRMFGAAGGRTLQVMAERPDTRQLTIDDCSELSRRVSDRLDEVDPIEGEYRLEVSSPGIDRPLSRRQDFADWRGHEARITLTEPLDGRKQFKGVLAGVDPEGVVAIDLGRDEHAYLPFDRIADAKLVLTDKLIAATQPLSTQGADELEDEPADDAEEEELN